MNEKEQISEVPNVVWVCPFCKEVIIDCSYSEYVEYSSSKANFYEDHIHYCKENPNNQ